MEGDVEVGDVRVLSVLKLLNMPFCGNILLQNACSMFSIFKCATKVGALKVNFYECPFPIDLEETFIQRYWRCCEIRVL